MLTRVHSISHILHHPVLSSASIGGALTEGALLLLNNATAATARVIEHAYGDEAGASARDGLAAVALVGEAALQMQGVGMRALAVNTVAASGACAHCALVWLPASARTCNVNIIACFVFASYF